MALDANRGTFFHGLQHNAGEAKEIELGHEFVVQWASSRYMCLTRRMVERFPCQRTDLAVIVPIQTENDAFALDLLFDLPDFLSVILEARHRYDLNPDCSQLAGEVSSWSRALPRARLSWTEITTSATRLMAMTVCTMSISQCQGVVFEPSTVRSTRMPFS